MARCARLSYAPRRRMAPAGARGRWETTEVTDEKDITGDAASRSMEEVLLRCSARERIYVTRPTLPPLEDYSALLKGIWRRKWLTNAGELHQELESRLCEFLGVEHLSLFCNGTIALLVALRLLDLREGEVITTPFTFPATAHALDWMGLTPVFCDIEADTYNIDPNRIEALITGRTRAILGVHVYGMPCDVDAIETIANKHGLRVAYDAAHGFGGRLRGRALAAHGDVSMLSFHATKLFSTIEGGALVVRDGESKRKVDLLKNFGIADAETVLLPGINGKMNEFQAAFGLLQLDMAPAEIAARGHIADVYRVALAKIPGIRLLPQRDEVELNNAYFPILIDPAAYGMTRDTLQTYLLRCNIEPRKYFYPLCSHYPCYRDLPSARTENLPVAERVAGQVLCLPMYRELSIETARAICEVVRELHAAVQ